MFAFTWGPFWVHLFEPQANQVVSVRVDSSAGLGKFWFSCLFFFVGGGGVFFLFSLFGRGLPKKDSFNHAKGCDGVFAWLPL